MSDEAKMGDQPRDPEGVTRKLTWLDNLPKEWRGVWESIQRRYAPTHPPTPVDLLEILKKAYARGYDSVKEPRSWLGGHWTECDQEEAEFALLQRQHGRGICSIVAELVVMGGDALGIKTGRHEVETGVCHGDYNQEREVAWACNLCGYLSGNENEPCDRPKCITRVAPIVAAQAATLAEQAKEIEYLRNPGATMRTVGDDKLLVCDGCSKIVTEPHGWIECCNTMRGSVASYERMIQQERDAYRDDAARLKAEVEAKAQRNALLVKAHKAAVYANAKLEMDPMDLDLEYAADVIQGNIRTEAWEQAVLEYVAIEDAQKEGRA